MPVSDAAMGASVRPVKRRTTIASDLAARLTSRVLAGGREPGQLPTPTEQHPSCTNDKELALNRSSRKGNRGRAASFTSRWVFSGGRAAKAEASRRSARYGLLWGDP
jgi:hypothetical protein